MICTRTLLVPLLVISSFFCYRYRVFLSHTQTIFKHNGIFMAKFSIANSATCAATTSNLNTVFVCVGVIWTFSYTKTLAPLVVAVDVLVNVEVPDSSAEAAAPVSWPFSLFFSSYSFSTQLQLLSASCTFGTPSQSVRLTVLLSVSVMK